MHPKFNAYLQLARISNLPTVFSNVLVGAALASGFVLPDWTLLALTTIAVSLFYIGGMALNDLLDRLVDQKERPHRPIPSGALSIQEARTFTFWCFLGGVLILQFSTPFAMVPGFGLIASICLYNFFHKRWSGSLIFMGICRALVYVVEATAVAPGEIMRTLDGHLFARIMHTRPAETELLTEGPGKMLIAAALLALYIIALTLVAQKEVSGGLGFRRWLAAALVLLPIPALCLMPVLDCRWTVPAGLILTLWLIRSARFIWQSPPKVVPAVLGWLAGISLLDAFFLTFTPFPWLSLAAFACFAVTVWGHRRIAGT
jgi:hypothetical protein